MLQDLELKLIKLIGEYLEIRTENNQKVMDLRMDIHMLIEALKTLKNK